MMLSFPLSLPFLSFYNVSAAKGQRRDEGFMEKRQWLPLKTGFIPNESDHSKKTGL